MASNKLTIIHLFCLLSVALVHGFWQPEARDLTDDNDYLYDDENSTNSSTTTEPPTSSSPVLSSEAIANIVITCAAVIFLTSFLCWQMYSFNRTDQRTRVKMALERNKQIDRQIAAARAKQQQKEAEQVGRIGTMEDIKEPEPQAARTELKTSGGASNVETLTLTSGLNGADRNVTVECKSDSVSPRQQEGHVTSEEIRVTTSEIIVDLEGQAEYAVDKNDQRNDGRSENNMLVDVSLDMGDEDEQLDPSVLLVQPAGPGLNNGL